MSLMREEGKKYNSNLLADGRNNISIILQNQNSVYLYNFT